MIGLYFIGVIALWLLLTWLLIRLVFRVREKKNVSLNTLMVGVILVWLGLSFWYGGGRKYYYDWQVNQLCSIDGGIKVYEMVELPKDKFNRWIQPNFYRPGQGESTLGHKYIFKKETTYYRQGNPEMSRTHYQVIRRSDNKLLGETVFYGRGGGDIPGPWHESSFVCPSYNEADSMALLEKIFIPVK